MAICDSDLYKTVNILADFAGMDTTKRLNHGLTSWCNYDDSGFLPYETFLGKMMNIFYGIVSSFSYMRLSIMQIKSGLPSQCLEEGYTEYDFYRYHYILFSHSVTLLKDLLFKFTSEVYELCRNKRMIQWVQLGKELNNNNLENVSSILEAFYKQFSNHIEKRNKFSHEGLLSYRSLDNYHMTYIWTQVNRYSRDNVNIYPQFTQGNEENNRLLKETKESFIDELKQLVADAEYCTQNLFEVCSDKILSRIDYEFLKQYSEPLRNLQHSHLNNYLDKLGL